MLSDESYPDSFSSQILYHTKGNINDDSPESD
jgi:hypothetical protein